MHSHEIRVYYKDTDCGNVVYYARYLEFLEAARMEFLQSLSLDVAVLHQRGVIFPVVEVNLKYHAPAHLGEWLEIQTAIQQIRNCSLILKQVILNKDKKKLVSGTIRLGCISPKGKPIRIPRDAEQLFLKQMQEEEKKK